MKITESERKKILGKYYSPQNLDIILEQVYISDNRVKEIQTLLNQKANARLAVDGKLGPKTLAAINSYFKVDAQQATATPTTPAAQPAAPAQTTATPSAGQVSAATTQTPEQAQAPTSTGPQAEPPVELEEFLPDGSGN